MNLTAHIYVPANEVSFMQWAQNRFSRNFSKVTLKALHEMLDYEWSEHLKKLNGGQQDSAE